MLEDLKCQAEELDQCIECILVGVVAYEINKL